MQDLIVLAADKTIQLAVKRLLARSEHLGFRTVSSIVAAHPDRDPGVLLRSHEFLRQYSRQYSHAIAICDREGSGSEGSPREELERRIEVLLDANGWEDRAMAVVIDPELEIWMWGDWRVLANCPRWHGPKTLREWLAVQRLLGAGEAKPQRPKEALRRVLKETGMQWSSAIHESMAANADTSGCVDAAFAKLRTQLQQWFPL